MSNFTKFLAGAAGLAAVAGFATPAAAQYYPGYGYNNGGGVVGAIVNSVIGGGQYGYGYGNYGGNDRMAVAQCSRAVEARLGGGYGGYGGGYGGYGYNNSYGGGGRVVGITGIERKNSGLRVRGIASRGGAYGYNGGANLTFSCKVDYRGRVVDLDLNRGGYGGYNGYNGYNNYGYRGY